MSMKNNMARGSRAVRKDPACGTCRKKCRKCDRTRPICNRCRSKGFHCEGYPPRFQFCDSISGVNSDVTFQERIRDSGKATSLHTHKPTQISTQNLSASAKDLEAPFDPPSRRHHLARILLRDAPSASLDNSSFNTTSLVQIIPHPEEGMFLTENDQQLLVYFDLHLSPHLAIVVDEMENPFRKHVLPLAYQHSGVFHAVLGLSACHLHLSPSGAARVDMATALQHRIEALAILSSLLTKEESQVLTTTEDEVVLAIVLLLVLHDICELGISSHAVHLTGISFLCGRVASSATRSKRSTATMFFLAALSWLDVLRGFSGAEKLTYPKEVRSCVANTIEPQFALHTFLGCPPEIFHHIGVVIAAAKCHLSGHLSNADFQIVLGDAQSFLRGMDLRKVKYPTEHPEWKQLAEAYRQACLLRTMRWPDTFAIPCEDQRIRSSVQAILECCANVPMRSPFYKRLLFPLFLAATDTTIQYEIHYASLCIDEIRKSTGFGHLAMMEVLEKVWEERNRKIRGWINVPWMEFTCSESMRQQHAYLFF